MRWAKAKQAAKVQESADTDSTSSDEEEAAEAVVRERRPSRSAVRRKTSSGGDSLWKPVFITIACLNISALAGLLYSAPWRPGAPKVEHVSIPSAHQVEHKLLIPVEAAITEDGKVRYPRKFLSGAPAAIRRKLIDSLKESTPHGADLAEQSREPSPPSAHSPTTKDIEASE